MAIVKDFRAEPADADLLLAIEDRVHSYVIAGNGTAKETLDGLAAERARAIGLNVSLVIVDDDVALPDLTHVAPDALADGLPAAARAARAGADRTAGMARARAGPGRLGFSEGEGPRCAAFSALIAGQNA